jgi:hypothetical protein
MKLLLSYYVLRYTSVQSRVAVIVILGQHYAKQFEAESVGVVSVSPSPSRFLVV